MAQSGTVAEGFDQEMANPPRGEQMTGAADNAWLSERGHETGF